MTPVVQDTMRDYLSKFFPNISKMKAVSQIKKECPTLKFTRRHEHELDRLDKVPHLAVNMSIGWKKIPFFMLRVKRLSLHLFEFAPRIQRVVQDQLHRFKKQLDDRMQAM